MRRANLVPLVLLATATLLAPAQVLAQAPANDCGTGGDAPQTAPSTVILATPVYRCDGALSTASDRDAFRIDAVVGDVIVLTSELVDRVVTLCLYDAALVNVACGGGNSGFTYDVTQAGAYHLVASATQPASYLFSLSTKRTAIGGTILAPHDGTRALPGHGVTGFLGPAHDGIDGDWVTLAPAPVVGAALRSNGNGIMDVYFYDAGGAEIGACFDVGFCGIPAGTSSILVTHASRSLPFVLPGAPWSLEYLH